GSCIARAKRPSKPPAGPRTAKCWRACFTSRRWGGADFWVKSSPRSHGGDLPRSHESTKKKRELLNPVLFPSSCLRAFVVNSLFLSSHTLPALQCRHERHRYSRCVAG